jgi:hypothetical protein
VSRALPLKLMAAAVASVFLPACATLSVNAYTAAGADMRQYRSYTWASSAAASTGDPRLDGNRFFEEAVRSRVDHELARRGFEKSDGATHADIVVHYHASVTQRIDLRTVDAPYAAVRDEGAAYLYDAGTLIIDLIDYRTNTLIWRGWAESSLQGVIDNQASMEAQIAEAVSRILQRLPRRL